MSLPELLVIFAGLSAEIGWLAGAPDIVVAWSQRLDRFLPRRLLPLYDRYYLWFWAAPLVILAFGLEQLPLGQIWFAWLDPLFTGIMVVALLIILYHTILGHGMLPRVNEGQMLLVHVIVVTTLLVDGKPALPTWLLWLTVIPTVALLWQALWPRPRSLTGQTIFYLWYLLSLLLLAMQNDNIAYFSQLELNSFELFVLICLFVFLAAHTLLGLRFLAISLSLLLPRNRPLLQLIMPHLIQPRPLPRRRVILLTGVALGLIALNHWLDLGAGLTVTNTLILITVQFDAHAWPANNRP